MTAFLSALGSGISAKKILEFLMRKSPDLKSKITTALASGITAEKILSFFSKDKNFEKLKSSLEDQYPMENNANPLVQAQNVRSQNLGTDMASGLQRQAPGLIGGAATIGTGIALQHALPNLLKGPISEKMQKNLETPQTPPTSQVAPSIPDNIARMQAEEKIMQSAQELERQQSLSKFNEKKSFAEREKERFEKGYGGPNVEEAQKLGKELTSVESKGKELDVSKEKAEVKPIGKKSVVVSPNGVGEVKEIRNGQALIDIDGKLHKVKEEDLEGEPPDIADLYDKLFAAIPEAHKSRMMNYAGYDEEHNELLFRPHGGGAYVYKDIPVQFAEELKKRLHRAKTTGSNMYGAWTKDDPSYGAGMSALIKQLQAQYGGKGKEYIRKYATLFDILGIPHEEKKRKEQEERRKRKGIS